MSTNLDDLRNHIVFARQESDFDESVVGFIDMVMEMSGNNQEREAVALVKEMVIDLQSWLIVWSLTKNVAPSKIENLIQFCYNFLEMKGARDAIELARAEADAIAGSMTVKACKLTDAGELAFFWGHDYCTGIDYSLRRGACFVTSNPAKINLYRKENAQEWAAMLAEVRKENPGIGPEETVMRMYVKVVSMIAARLRPIYDASNGKYGFVCIQPNPTTTKDSEAMTDEVLFYKGQFEKIFHTKNPNIVYKIPAVPAALETVKALKKHGLRLCITLNFSVFQHDLFSDLLTGGDHGDFLVLMGGIVDDMVKGELVKNGMDEKKATEVSHSAATAVLRNSYANLKSKGINPIIMAGSVRGAWSVLSCFTKNTSRPVALTSMADMMALFDTQPRVFDDTVNQPIDGDILKALMQSTVFRQAYEISGLSCENLEAYPPLIKVSDSFVAAYKETLESVK